MADFAVIPRRRSRDLEIAETNQARDWYETLLAIGAICLFIAISLALLRGASRWVAIDELVWAHLVTVMVPLSITPFQLLRRRGGTLHRTLGWIWSVLLLATACITFFIRETNDGGLSFIHILSALTLTTVPILVWTARIRRINRHRRAVRGLVTGAMLAAGYFTLMPGRILGNWLFG